MARETRLSEVGEGGRPDAHFTRKSLSLDEREIGTRLIFDGTLTRQLAYEHIPTASSATSEHHVA